MTDPDPLLEHAADVLADRDARLQHAGGAVRRRGVSVGFKPSNGAGASVIDRDEDLLFFMRALHNAQLLPHLVVSTLDGEVVEFDPLADDGEHPGHTSPMQLRRRPHDEHPFEVGDWFVTAPTEVVGQAVNPNVPRRVESITVDAAGAWLNYTGRDGGPLRCAAWIAWRVLP